MPKLHIPLAKREAEQQRPWGDWQEASLGSGRWKGFLPGSEIPCDGSLGSVVFFFLELSRKLLSAG